MAKQLVKLRTRPSRDGQIFTYMLDYVDGNGIASLWDMVIDGKPKARDRRENGN